MKCPNCSIRNVEILGGKCIYCWRLEAETAIKNQQAYQRKANEIIRGYEAKLDHLEHVYRNAFED